MIVALLAIWLPVLVLLGLTAYWLRHYGYVRFPDLPARSTGRHRPERVEPKTVVLLRQRDEDRLYAAFGRETRP